MRVVDHRATRRRAQPGDEQPLVVMRVNHLDVITTENLTESSYEQRIQDEQLRSGGSRLVVSVPAHVSDPMHAYAAWTEGVAEVIRDDVYLVAPLR
jgi:hypothetical protein